MPSNESVKASVLLVSSAAVVTISVLLKSNPIVPSCDVWMPVLVFSGVALAVFKPLGADVAIDESSTGFVVLSSSGEIEEISVRSVSISMVVLAA